MSVFNFSKKGVSVFLVLALAVFFLFSCAAIQNKHTDQSNQIKLIPQESSYTYDGEFDPMVFFAWNIIRKGVCSNGHWHFYLKNPDEKSDVKFVETMNVNIGGSTMRIVAYRYFKNNIEYIFMLDVNKGHYTQRAPKPIDKSKGI